MNNGHNDAYSQWNDSTSYLHSYLMDLRLVSGSRFTIEVTVIRNYYEYSLGDHVNCCNE